MISEAGLLAVQITAHKHSKQILVLQNALLKLTINCKEKIAMWFIKELFISNTILTETEVKVCCLVHQGAKVILV